MLDDLDRLRDNPQLLQLLSHYAHLGEVDQEVWQSRLVEMADVGPQAIVKLHGELIAMGWVEQNTGQFSIGYRITPAGLRAMRRVQAQEIEDNCLPFPGNRERQPRVRNSKKAA